MTDDQHQGAPGTPGAWQPIAPGEYEDSTAFVELPEGLTDGYGDAASPLAAPGHGYTPPPITVAPAAGEAADPAGVDMWAHGTEGVPEQPTGQEGVPGAVQPGAGQPGAAPAGAHPQPVHWPDPNVLPPQDAHPHTGDPADPSLHTGYGYDLGAAGPTGDPQVGDGAGGSWHLDEDPHGGAAAGGPGEDGAAGAPGTSEAAGGWSIPLAQGDLPDESGEFTTSVLAAQWGGVPPATLPGGATAPWATDPGRQETPHQEEPRTEHTQAHRMQQGVRIQRARRAHQAPYQDEPGRHPGAGAPAPDDPSHGARTFQDGTYGEQPAAEQGYGEVHGDDPLQEPPYEGGPYPEQPFGQQHAEEGPLGQPPGAGEPGHPQGPNPYGGPAPDPAPGPAHTAAGPAPQAPAAPGTGGAADGADQADPGDDEDIYVGPLPAASGPAAPADPGRRAGGPHPGARQPEGDPTSQTVRRRPARRPLQDTRVQQPLPGEHPEDPAPETTTEARPADPTGAAGQPRAGQPAAPQADTAPTDFQEPGPAPRTDAPHAPQEPGNQHPGAAVGTDPAASDPAAPADPAGVPGGVGPAPEETGSPAPAQDATPESGVIPHPRTHEESVAAPDAVTPDDAAPDAAVPAPDPQAHGHEAQDAGDLPEALEAGQDGDDRGTDGQDEAAPAADSPFGDDEHPLVSYALRVNGTERPVTDAWIGESLLYVLRERLGLAGAKDGCSQGECGACNVQVDGRLVASCLVPAATTAGSEVRTVEGLAEDGRPSDVQRALAECGAVQCGFCVPGMAMTVHDLLAGNPDPTDLETRSALSGNLCRCSGYRGVLDAVRQVVEERRAAGEDRGPGEPTQADADPGQPAGAPAATYPAHGDQPPHQAGPPPGDGAPPPGPYATSYDQVAYDDGYDHGYDDGGRV